MKKIAGCIILSFFLLFPALSHAQNWYFSTDLGKRIEGIGAADDDNVWAALGSGPGEGKIYFYDGSSWSIQTTLFPGGGSELKAVEALDSTHIWVGGEHGTNPLIYFYNGSDWSFQCEVEGLWLNDIYAADQNQIWFTGNEIYVSWNGGASWDKETEGTYNQFGIDGQDQGNKIWTVGGPYGSSNQILVALGSVWSVQTEIANWGTETVRLRDVCVVTDGDVWAAGDPGHILHYDGSDWTVSTRVAGEDFQALAARNSSNAWAGSASGRIFYWNGSEWSLDTILSANQISGLSASADEIWAANAAGEIYRFGAGTPTPVPTASAPPTATPTSTTTPTPSPSSTPEGLKTPIPTCTPPPTPACGCVGDSQTFYWGETITEDCALNGDLAFYYTCFTVGTDNITIDGNGYTIRSLKNDHSSGILLEGRSNVTIRDIGIEQFSYGILAEDCEYINILDSVISDNIWWQGIYFIDTTDSTISGNTLDGNGLRTGGQAIEFLRSSFNEITGNAIDNSGTGIGLVDSSDNNTITGNNVTNSEKDGILITTSDNNLLTANTFCSNAWSWVTTAGYSDIRVDSGTGNTGENNFCDSAAGYNDDGSTGCTFNCTPGWINDYDGDGTSDIGIFRESSGLWAIRGLTRLYFGGSSDLPQPGDYDGDGTTDITIFRDSTGLWAIRTLTRVYFGSSADTTIAADYDGDGTTEVAIFRPASGLWAIRTLTRVYFGSSSDTAVPGYYDSKAARPAIFRPSSGLWAVRGLTRLYFGSSTDTTVPGDYDASGAWEAGIFRETSGLWAIRGVTRRYFGSGSDRPVPGIYKGDGTDNIGIFRETSGLWAIRGISRVYFGSSGDIPVTR